MAELNAEKNKTPFPVRLQLGIESSQKMTANMLESYNHILQCLSAGWYESRDASTSRPINLIWRYYNIMMAYLAARTPKSLVTAKGNIALSGAAYTLSLALDHLKAEISYQDMLEEVVQTSLGFAGMVKTGICRSASVMIGDTEHEVGQPYCDAIDADDQIFDVKARRWRQSQFIGNRYRVRLDYLKTSGLFKNYDRVTADSSLYSSETAPEQVAKPDVTSQEYQDLHEHATVYDLYLPDEKIMVTLPQKGQGDKFLRVVDEFPETGPFDLLTYNKFPGSIIPIPPAYSILDLDEQLNRVARRLKRRDGRDKTVLAYDSASATDAERVVATADGEAVAVENVDRLKEIHFGGVEDRSIFYADWLERNASEQGGNLHNIGGIRPEAKTLGQEQIMTQQAQGPILKMLKSVETLCAAIEKKLAWYLISDPLIKIPLIKKVSGYPSLAVEYSEYTKEGDFLDYNFDIIPYSTQGSSPEATWMKLMQVVNQMVLPTLEIGAQQGQVLDVRRLTEIAGRFLDIPELKNVYVNSAPQKADVGPYQPMQGQVKPKSGQPDGRISTGGFNEVSNLNQQQTRTGAA